MRYISEEQFKKILEKLNVEYRGITKSGEPRLAYNGREFLIGRKEKIRGGEEGYKIDVANKIIQHVALERSKQEKKTPGEIGHSLRQELKKIIGADF